MSFNLKTDKSTQRIIDIIKDSKKNAETDLDDFWLSHGKYDLWKSAIERAEEIISRGNKKAIEAAFIWLEAELSDLVGFHKKFKRWAEAVIRVPNGEKVHEPLISRDMRDNIQDKYWDKYYKYEK